MGGTKFILYMVELARFMVDSFIIPEVKKEMHQVLTERSDLMLAVFGKLLRKILYEFNFFC